LLDQKKYSLRRLAYIFLFGFSYLFNFSQDHFQDSLRSALKSAKNDTTRCNILSVMIEAESNDSIWPIYNEEVKKLAEKNLKGNLNPQLKRFFLKCLADALNNIGYLSQIQGNIPKALEYFQASLKKHEEIGNKKGIAYQLNQIGLIYKSQGEIQNALDYFIKASKISDETRDKQLMASSVNNVGMIYNIQGNILLALEYYETGLKIHEEMGDKNGMAISSNNIGFLYQQQGNIPKAIECFNRSLKLWEETGNVQKIGFMNDMIGYIYLKQKDYLNAGKYGTKALDIARKINYPEDIRNACQLLYFVKKKTNKPAEALEMYEDYIVMRDSINNRETRKASIKSQLKYEFERKAANDSIKTQEERKVSAAKLAESSAKLKQERTQRYALYGGLGLVGLFAVFMVNRFRVTNSQKKIIEEQKKTVEVQKHEVEEKQKEILDSIRYAKRIQMSLLSSEKHIEKTVDRLKQNRSKA
jgi:tetratricopeptide (TPR) repeat protein